MHSPKSFSARAGLTPRLIMALALALPALPLTGCGGKGGGGDNSGQDTVVRVLSVTPNQGPFIGGTTLLISGQQFLMPEDGLNEVRVGGVLCTEVVVLDAETLTCKSPAGTPGAQVDVTVTNSLGSGKLVNGFRYLLPAPPASDINDDGIADLVIGASDDDSVGSNAGAVYIFLGSTDPLALQDRATSAADVKLYGKAAGDLFGASICMGDLNADGVDDLVIGAEGVDGLSTVEVGAAYVFFGPIVGGTTLSAAAADQVVLGDVSVSGDRFGSAVEVADVNADGTDELMASATRHDQPGKVDAGCVYVLNLSEGPSGVGVSSALASFDGAQQNQRLGDSITCGDIDDDAGVDLLIGAMGGDPLLPPVLQIRGRVYCMNGGESLASLNAASAALVFSGDEVDDRFGAKTSVGDLNADGIDDLVVCAPANDYYGADFGRAYVFFGGAGIASAPAAAAQLKFSGLYSHNSLGSSLVVADANGDFIADIVVGAPQSSSGNLGDGRVYVFHGGPNLPQELVATQADDVYVGEPNLQEGFGRSVSLLDLNGDGLADLAAGTTNHYAGSGRVYVFHWTGVHGVERSALQADSKYTGAALYQGLGNSLAEGL